MEEIEYEVCPRCGKKQLHPIPAMNALSRRDNQTYICSPCGSYEAILDVSRHEPGLVMQLMEFMDLEEEFKVMTEQEELDSWVVKGG